MATLHQLATSTQATRNHRRRNAVPQADGRTEFGVTVGQLRQVAWR